MAEEKETGTIFVALWGSSGLDHLPSLLLIALLRHAEQDFQVCQSDLLQNNKLCSPCSSGEFTVL